MGVSTRPSLHNLPRPLTSFVGRETELARIEMLLARHRLVTAVGPGGSGKTRLAVQVARRLVGRFEDGVWLVELGQIGDPGLVALAVAGVLGVRQHPGLSMADSLARAVGARHLLLVLDNCEHVLDAAADVSDALLAAGDDLRILATSRQALDVAGEARLSISSMTTPAEDSDSERVGDFEAVQLFTERASEVGSEFALNSATRSVVADIVRRLDGMPLAIEIAAAQLDVMGLDDLRSGLAGRPSDLAKPTRGAPDRQTSLEASIAWSYQLLEASDQIAFRRLAVLPAPFSLEAGGAAIGPHVREEVNRLVRRSMLLAPAPGSDGRPRHRMLATLRSYASARLDDSGETLSTRSSVLRWYVDEAERVATSFKRNTTELAAMQWVDAEQDNIREILDWAAGGEPELGLRLAIAISPWLVTQARWREGRALLERALASNAELSPELVGNAERWLGQLTSQQPDNDAALAHLTRAMELLDPLGPSPALVDVLWLLSVPAHSAGHVAEGAATAHRALDIAREISYATGEVKACVCLAVAAIDTGDSDNGLFWAREANAVDPSMLEGWALRWQFLVLAWALDASGDLAASEQAAAKGLEACKPVGDLYAGAHLVIALATIEVRTGRFEQARPRILDSLDDATKRGDGASLLGALETAVVWLARWPETAATVFGIAGAVAEATGYSYAEHYWNGALVGPVVESLRSELGERYSIAETFGRQMNRDQALTFVRTELEDAVRSPSTFEPAANLSRRERELLDLLAEGLTDAQIATKLFISIRTVRSHLDRIRDKTGFRRRAELTRLALRAQT